MLAMAYGKEKGMGGSRLDIIRLRVNILWLGGQGTLEGWAKEG